ncbi:MAG: DUF2254 domain-containing protein [Actinobacteria bacterium]|nr:DUF2254 domain-containing protein [Actinomycetota bacterium]
MKARLLKYWDGIRSSFWFLPAVMAAASVAIALATVTLDATLDWSQSGSIGSYAGGADGARAVLTTVAGSMITIAGVVFSLTLVALTLASSQFGPRLLRSFMADKANQVVLGTFIATFLYCLIVLRTVKSPGQGPEFIPQISVTTGVLLAVASLGVLIYFIHHVAMSIQADVIVGRVAADLDKRVNQLFPAQIGRGVSEGTSGSQGATFREGGDKGSANVTAPTDGYIQFIDAAGLMKLAVEEDVVVRLERRPGHYVTKGDPVATVWRLDGVDDSICRRLSSTFALGTQRTPAQDVEHAVNQLVEVAIRALSPGINDPFTAVVCVDRLGSALRRLSQREIPSGRRLDEQGRLRVLSEQVTFSEVLDTALSGIRESARSHAAITVRLLETIESVARTATREEDLGALRRHAAMVVRSGRQGLGEPYDVKAVEESYRTAVAALDSST